MESASAQGISPRARAALVVGSLLGSLLGSLPGSLGSLGSLVGVLLAGCAARPSPARSLDRTPAPQQASAAREEAKGGAPDTAEACRACNGDFGVHGLDPTPRCLCRTRDAGKRCRAKDDCQGECLGDAGEREVTDPGPPPRGFFLGRCSELKTVFGCHRFLGRRRAEREPVPLDETQPELCVD